MTEMQAHKFVERWERITFPERWRAKTEIQAVERLEKMFAGFMAGTFAVMLTSMDHLFIKICAVFILGFLAEMYLRSRKALRLLSPQPIVNRKS